VSSSRDFVAFIIMKIWTILREFAR